jgi:signal transduction histidine kinase
MKQVVSTLELRGDADVVAARQRARQLAETLGFDRQSQTRIATAVSEIARNAVAYAGSGEVEFALDLAGDPPRFIIVVHDRGPGIADLGAILEGRRDFAPGHGTGLLSARRLIHELTIDSQPGRGTQVTLCQRMSRAMAAGRSVQALAADARTLPPASADPIVALHEQNRELIASLDETQERQQEAARLNLELEETNRGVVALYSELESKADQLRQASELKSRFLSHMSHEFRTPLNSILALSRLLQDHVDGDLNAEQERQVEYIRRSAQSLLEMVNDLLDLAKVEAGKLEIKPEELSVAEVFSGLRGAFKPLLSNPAVELVFEPVDGLPGLYSDPAKLAQILRNFISNALKFTEAGRVTVAARHDAAAQRLVFSVADTGIGIPEQDQALIFEEFTQVDGRLQRGGTGLGLSLSRSLAMLLGGHITLVSAPGRGSTFGLVLPLRWGESDPVASAAEAAGGSRILIVDDEEAFRYVIRHIVRDAGLVAVEAGDGVRGLELAREARPDAVILDLQMPRMDGYAMLQQLADDAALREVPVIVCTSQALSLEQKRMLASAYAIVPKHDLSRDGLTALLHAVLPPGRSPP